MKRENSAMKFQWRGFISGVLLTLACTGLISSAVASSYKRQATLNYTGIKITVDGKRVTPTDANGKTIDPFAIDGVTYLPVRGIASTLGLGVGWNQSTQTVQLTTDGSAPPSQPPVTATKLYPNTAIPMFEQISGVPYSSSYIAKDGTGAFYQYPLLELPEIADVDDNVITQYGLLLVSKGFEYVQTPGEGAVALFDNKTTGESLILESVGPDDGFNGYYFIVTVFYK